MRPSPWPPDLARLDAVGLGGGVSQLLEGVSAVCEILGAVGLEFEFAGADLGAVLFALQFTYAGEEPVGGAVEAPGLGVEHVDEAPEEVRALVGKLCPVGCCLCEDAEGLCDGGGGFVPRPRRRRESNSSGPGVAPKSAACSQTMAVKDCS